MVLAILCVLLVLAAWRVLIGPAREALSTRTARVAMLRREVARAQATADKLALVERDVRALETSLERTTAVLPDERDPQDVLRSLHELASQTTMNLSSFSPRPIVMKAQYAEWPIQIGLDGGYHDLGRFFDLVATMPRLMAVSDLDIKTNTRPTSKNTITATCVATTFVFRKDTAAPAAGGAK